MSKGKIMGVDMSGLPSRFRHVTSLGQIYTEEIIAARFETLGGQIYKGWSVEDVTVSQDKAEAQRPVTVTLTNEDGVEVKVRCCLIIGADGSHSVVREKAGIAFEGGRWNETFLNADVVVRDPSWPFSQASGERNGRRGGMNVVSEDGALMMIPLAGGGLRLAAVTGLEEIDRSIEDVRRRSTKQTASDVLVDDNQKQDRGGHLVETIDLGADKVQTVLDLLGPTVEADAETKEKPSDITKIVWTSAYHVAHRIASEMFKAEARTVVIGDACHTHSPMGGQGLNAGVTDALQLSQIVSATEGRSLFPFDLLLPGKAARKRELKRNKEERAKVREVATVKKDTRPLEADIRRLESKGSGALSQGEREELERLKTEVRRIREAKEAYVKEHPEHRKFVFAREMEEEEESKRKQKEGQEMEERNRDAKRPWEGRDPRWSQDYDPVFNPLGAPPPGMPYREKTKEQFEAEYGVEDESAEEEDSDANDDDDDHGDDIVMPDGPPPLPQEEDEGDSDADSDGIMMPEGPPPGPPPSGPKAMTAQPPLPPGPPPPPQGPALAYGRPFRPTYQPHHHPRPPPPPGFGNNVPYGAPQGMPYIGGPPPPAFGGLPPRPPRPYAASARPSVAPPGPPPQRPPATISVAPSSEI
ncbi:hypothetical protein L7F22_064652 [Adiantum nelumboides]|nr:hypothetical protein [Adiantum nelumboides]